MTAYTTDYDLATSSLPLADTAPPPSTSRSPALAAIYELISSHPIPDSAASNFPKFERDYSILRREVGIAAAEATMWDVFAFEQWRRSKPRRRASA